MVPVCGIPIWLKQHQTRNCKIYARNLASLIPSHLSLGNQIFCFLDYLIYIFFFILVEYIPLQKLPEEGFMEANFLGPGIFENSISLSSSQDQRGKSTYKGLAGRIENGEAKS